MGRNPLVMIIDEDPIFRQELQGMLTPARLAVVADCGYGVEAASLAEELKPDLILASIEEPVARAIQTIEAVRGIRPGAPVIAYSSSTELHLVRQAMHAGVRDLLAHPFKVGELLTAIEAVMRSASLPGEAAPQPQAAGTILTVFGAKGGIGKTTITTNIATAIARDTDSSVLVMDLDTRFGDVAIMLDIDPAVTVAEMAGQVATLDRASFKAALVEHESGVFVLPSPKHPNDWRQVQADDIKELARFASRMFDYVILDTPGAFNDVVGAALEVATQVLVVTSVDMASIKDTSFILDVLESEGFPDDRLFLTVNHPNGANTIRAADIERVLRKKVFWEIPHDAQMTMATQIGLPVVLARPKSRAASNLAGLAGKITGRDAPARESKGFLRRLIPAGSRN
ncbi:MAG: response regulator [Dehalococcoidia bacterium]|nr:response regulator [Dehalococcoidia bacterium]